VAQITNINYNKDHCNDASQTVKESGESMKAGKSFARSQDMEWSQKSKSTPPDPFLITFDLILIFFNSVPVISMRAKFEVSSFTLSPRYGGVPKFQKYVPS